MWKAVAIAVIFGSLASPSIAETCMGVRMPPMSARQKPTVYYDQYFVPQKQFDKLCPGGGAGALACSYASPTKAHPDRWQIVIMNDLALKDRACIVTYELSHLPPNYWGDPKVETPAVIDTLSRHGR